MKHGSFRMVFLKDRAYIIEIDAQRLLKAWVPKINPLDLLSEHLFSGYFMTPRLITLIVLPICKFPPVIIFVILLIGYLKYQLLRLLLI